MGKLAIRLRSVMCKGEDVLTPQHDESECTVTTEGSSWGEVSLSSSGYSSEGSATGGSPVRLLRMRRKEREMQRRGSKQIMVTPKPVERKHCATCVDESLINFLKNIESFNTPQGEKCTEQEFWDLEIDYSIPLHGKAYQLIVSGTETRVDLHNKDRYVDLAHQAIKKFGCVCQKGSRLKELPK
eukprot:TRINITY_DN9968_c0_g1_i1.p1 TRINITY_DN9968_c0_g1~~TRINITY_DN9968_c0_g1_i1.p1  ORF type:complete len:198 (+),score=37.00 TRINITY_DN9968_c0_g1_i1:43-594(+)